MYLDDRRPTITPQLARRVAIMGGLAAVVLGIVFFRLWYLQVLSGERYVAEANNNRVREIKVAAPRGEIVDRNGRTLVDNRMGLAVRITPNDLPREQEKKTRLYNRLAELLDMQEREIRSSVREQLRALPFSAATVKQDVGLPLVQYIEENQKAFPGVTTEKVFLRSYPHDEVGAHLFGTVGEVSAEQLRDKRYREVEQGDRIGQSGIESTYDRFLRGVNGATKVQVDATGSLTPRQLPRQEPVPGRQLRLSLDLNVQQTAHEALGARKGAFVVMDVKSGQVHALGSSPSFDPNRYVKRIRDSDYRRLTSKALGEPLLNRAVQGDYPAGSTFKLVSSVAALEGGLIEPGTTVFDPGVISVGGRDWQNARKAANGPVDMRQALEVSSDVYYYRLGQAANATGDGRLLQRWAGRLGIGRTSGIDLPAELPGVVPSPEWRDRLFKERKTDRPWSVGDNMNLSVGQGDLSTNPLQMAVAYAAVANGGWVVRPRLGMRVEDGQSRPVQELKPPARRRVNVSAQHRQVILDGLRRAASGPRGTSTDVFKDFPIQIAGKTGTAEKGLARADQAWYIALAPYPDPQYVVAVTLEEGGFGAETAAPAARRILASLFGVAGDERKVVRGSSQTN